jgi:hypothetical protein
MNSSKKISNLLMLPLDGKKLAVGDFVICVKDEPHIIRFLTKRRISSEKLPDIETAAQSAVMTIDYLSGKIESSVPVVSEEPVPGIGYKTALTVGKKYQVISFETRFLGELSIGVIDDDGANKKFSQNYFNVK